MLLISFIRSPRLCSLLIYLDQEIHFWCRAVVSCYARQNPLSIVCLHLVHCWTYNYQQKSALKLTNLKSPHFCGQMKHWSPFEVTAMHCRNIMQYDYTFAFFRSQYLHGLQKYVPFHIFISFQHLWSDLILIFVGTPQNVYQKVSTVMTKKIVTNRRMNWIVVKLLHNIIIIVLNTYVWRPIIVSAFVNGHV